MTPRAKAAVAVVAVALAVGFIAWRLLRGDVAGTSTIADPRVAPAPVGRAPSTDAAATTSRATVEPAGAVAATPFAPEAADVDAVRLLVLDADSGEPVPGAEVAWSPRPALMPTPGRALRREDSPLANFDALTTRTRTDDEGVALVPRRRDLLVAARSGGRSGETVLSWDDFDEARVVIGVEPIAAARVLDATGAPAVGVPVRFTSELGSLLSGRSALTAAPDGVATLSRWSDWPPSRAAVRGVGVGEPWDAPPVRTSAEELAAGPVTLRLPPSAPVAVRVVGPDGRPLAESAEVLLGRGRETDGPGAVSRIESEALAATTDAESVARFAYAPAGLPLAVRVLAPSYDSAVVAIGTLAEGVEGPTIEVRMGAARTLCVGRAVEPGGAPLSGARIALEIASPHGFRRDAYPAEVVADGDGRFSFVFDRTAWTGFARVALTVVDDGPLPRVGSTELLPVVAGGTAVLGDVRCARDAIASGRVVDRAGRPVAGVRVRLGGRVSGDACREDAVGRGTTLLRVGGAISAADGSFALPWPAAARPFEEGALEFSLHAIPPFAEDVAEAARTEFRPPAREVTLTVAPTATLEVRLKLPARPPLGKLSLDVVARGEIDGRPFENRRTYERRIDSRGRFVVGGLSPGTCDVRVLLAGSDRPLAEILDVALRDGETTRDPRLQDVELTGLAR